MPKDKDFKRLIRARMAKTGESYTTARAHLSGEQGSRHRPGQLPEVYETLAGMSDEAVVKATGKDWPTWASHLDGVEAYTWEHARIARHIDSSFDCGGWWAQTVTVAYERFRGLRDYGQRRGGGYDVNKSRTIAVPLDALWGAFADIDTLGSWTDEPDLHFHRMTEPKSMRGSLPDGTKVDVHFTAKTESKSAVSIQHRGLPSREAADELRIRWGERLDRLVTHLGAE